jgi:chromosome segregation protein
MYLNKLEIIGFKSFADKVRVEFDSGMTAIVGPNGCGKTNIVDAVRWAIGEQKASVLRSSTMENVIFNGTKNRKALGYAEVSLTIENTKGILPSEYSDITITRRCFRDGTSNYLLNGVQCRLKDITALFMDTGMGADAYSVIELKMVNDILSTRTQDRRKLFEEAAGITKYKERRREALYKLEVARENLNEANIEIRNRQRQVNAFERIAQKQQEAREVSDKLKDIEIDYHQRYVSKLVEETREVEAELKAKEEEREKLQGRINENESVKDGYRKELDKTEAALNEVREKLGRVSRQLADLQQAISLKEQRIEYLRENIERFSKEKVELESEIAGLEMVKNELEDKILVLKDTLELSQESLGKKKTALEEVDRRVKSSKDELKDLNSKYTFVTRMLHEREGEYNIAKSRLESQLQRSSKLTDENIANINKVAEIDRELEELENKLTEGKSQLMSSKLRYEELKKTKEEIQGEINRLEKVIIYKTNESEKLKEKIEFQINLLENYEDYSEGVKFLVKERREKDAKTIIDCVEVENKFKVAIETALGEISNYLIVNNAEAAEKFIEILRENEKGKITFILRDDLHKSTFNIFQEEFPEILKQEGVYGWADRFVKCPDEYLLLYKYLLDEYIIVENLDIAKRLARGNFIKFITLDGDIVTSSFLRAGSRTNVETMKIGREKLIEEFRQKRIDIESSVEEDKKNLAELRTKNEKTQLEPSSETIQTVRAEISAFENKLAQLNYLKSQTNALIDNNNQESASLSGSNKELSGTIDKLILEIENAENEKYQREKELEHFTTELEHLADELTEKRDEYNNFRVEVTKLNGELKNLENELIRTVESIQTRQNTIMTREKECAEYESEIVSLKSEIGANGGLQQKHRELESEKASVETDFNFAKSEYDAMKTLVDKLEDELKQLRGNRDYIVKYVHQNEMQLQKDRWDIKEHKERMKEEYDMEIDYKDYEDKQQYDYYGTKAEIDRLRMKLKMLGGTGQLELGLYEQEKAELERLIAEKEDLLKAEQDLINLIEQINKTAQEKFIESFELIRANFQGIFRELFMEGDEADLKLVLDPENPDPLDAKIDIIAKPRGKRPQLIDLLSGGEKTLTAIALLFAIYQVKPSPFCILDEVDAPLDDANIDRFIKIIRKFSEDTQFIIVTHNKRTMEAADSMYGVTMAEEGISTIVNVRFRDAVAV